MLVHTISQPQTYQTPIPLLILLVTKRYQIRRSTGHIMVTPRNSAGQKKTIFSCPRLQLRIWSREIGSAVPFHVSLLILHTQVESGAYSRDSSSFPRRYLVIYAVNRHRISPEFISSQIAYRWRSMPRVRRHRARSRQGSSNDGCCLFKYRHGAINVRLSFPTPTNGM